MSDGKFLVILVMSMAIMISFSSLVARKPFDKDPKNPIVERANVIGK